MVNWCSFRVVCFLFEDKEFHLPCFLFCFNQLKKLLVKHAKGPFFGDQKFKGIIIAPQKTGRPTVGQQYTDKWPTVYQQTANR